MGGGYLSDAGVFLVQVLFGFAVIIVLVRILLQIVRANFFNPVCQFIVKVTNPVLIPMKKIVPNWGRLDMAAVLLAWLLQMIELGLTVMLMGGGIAVATLLAYSFVQLIDLTVLIFMFVIFVKIILSWVSPYSDNPIQPVLFQLSEPILGPCRRVLPPMGGLDLSPMLALIALQLTRILLVRPLMDLARAI